MPAKGSLKEINVNQLKFTLNETYNNYENLTTNFENSYDENVSSKAYLDTKTAKKRLEYHFQ